MMDLASMNIIPANMPAPSKENKKQAKANGQTGANGNIPRPKTHKPRPHVCTTCDSSFARLEHLQRHERSHTKEKPFECPDCARCFVRRDLLLRHQQKLHLTSTSSSRPRHGRQESTNGAPGGANRVRKNSIANTPSMRPRANTISHISENPLSLPDGTNPPSARNHSDSGHAYHSSLGSSVGSSMDHKGLSTEYPPVNGLTELENSGLLMGIPDSLRMAPAYGSFDMGIDGTLMDHGSTINPAKLHFAGLPQRFPLRHNAHDMHLTMNEEINFDWMNEFDAAVALENNNNSSINDSSPSAMSMGSQCMVSEAMLDGPIRIPISNGWHSPFPAHASTNQFAIGLSPTTLAELGIPSETVPPKSLMAQSPFAENYVAPPSMTSAGQSIVRGHAQIPNEVDIPQPQHIP